MSTDAPASNSPMPESDVAIALSVGALLLGALCLTLLVLALRRLLGHHEEVVATMLQRYDHRLAEFAQTLNDALNQTLPARITAAISGAPIDTAAVETPDHSNVVRVLELAREQTAADAAVAIVGTEAGADPRDGRPLADGGRPGRRSRRARLPRRPGDSGLVRR